MARTDRGKGMWCLVMFDLPVKKAQERREATRFRNMLVDSGFSMVQLSVYVQYLPLGVELPKIAQDIKKQLPKGGEVRIVPLTDKQWSEAFRFCNGTVDETPKKAEQLQIF